MNNKSHKILESALMPGALGMVLTAGGARGAYQAGVLKRVGEISSLKNRPSPFPIVAGASAGAINVSALAAGANNFSDATCHIANIWAGLKMEEVYRTDLGSLSSLVVTLLKDLSLGGLFGGGHAQSLLDFSPLRDLLSKHIRFDQIQDAVKSGHLYAIAVTATNYYSGKSFIFIQGREGHPTWEKTRRVALSAELTADHILASCAIPIVFQPIQVSTSLGDFYFGDGGLRLVAPLSPAIRLGAERIFAIGIRSQKASEERSKLDLLSQSVQKVTMKKPPLAQIVGVSLNSFFLDHLDTDVEHLIRVNDIVQNLGASSSEGLKEPIKILDHLVVQPSVDLAEIANSHSSKMPRMISYLMEGLGTSRSETGDLMSYLLFDSAYTQDLIHLGYRDAHDRIDEIEAFIATDKARAKSA